MGRFQILGRRLTDWIGLTILAGLVSIMLFSNWKTGKLSNPHLVLAYNFWEGRLDVGDSTWFVEDMSYFEGKYYLPQGPLPALILAPFVKNRLYWTENNTGYLNIFFNLVNLGLVFKISMIVLKDKWKAMWASLVYLFASPYIGISMESAVWYQGQLVAATGLLFSVLMYLSGKSWWWVGMGVAWAMGARLNSALFGVFYGLEILLLRIKVSEKLVKLLSYGTPILLVLVGLGWYNLARFGSPGNSGYQSQVIFPQISAYQRDKGWYRWENIPTNIYYYFLRGYDPVLRDTKWIGEYRLEYPFFTLKNTGPGLSFFFVAPFFLFIFRRKPKGGMEWRMVFVCGLILFTLMMFFATGARQFGPRYINDLLPLLFLLLLRVFEKREMGAGAKLVALGSAVFNMYVYAGYNGMIR